MKKVKIWGAGSIGNHLSNAARQKGWDVTLCDIDNAALERTLNEIYPARYGNFDDEIKLMHSDNAPKGGYDYIFIGTPPDSHIPLALEAVKEKPKAILVEKPFATPDLKGCQELYDLCKENNVKCFVGYDHAVAKSTKRFIDLAKNIDEIKTFDVFFREHWQGIFNAHPWLDGPSDTYLGYWKRGGGALGEHSHALHLWQSIAQEIGAGKVIKVSATLDYINDRSAEFDRLALLNLTTENGLVGSVVQDVVTKPTLKSMRIQGKNEALEWQCVPSPYKDVLRVINEDASSEEVFEKSRPDDFITELTHLEDVLENNTNSPISIESGLDAMLVIAAAHLSAQSGQSVSINYNAGYTSSSLALSNESVDKTSKVA